MMARPRHSDGHVREECLLQIVAVDRPWLAPFVVQLLGEYVIEIVEVIAATLHEHGPERLAGFARETRSSWPPPGGVPRVIGIVTTAVAFLYCRPIRQLQPSMRLNGWRARCRRCHGKHRRAVRATHGWVRGLKPSRQPGKTPPD